MYWSLTNSYYSKKDILKRLEGFFKEADTDKDGYLSMEELSSTLRKYGYSGSLEEIQVSIMTSWHGPTEHMT